MPNTREKLIEVKQTLEMCYKQGITSECNGCAYRGHNNVCMDALMEDALAVINQLESNAPVQKWIPVTERLPQEKGEICKNAILFMDDGLVTVGWLNEDIRCAFYLDTRNDFVSKVPISRCTHWMPLPEPPKGE